MILACQARIDERATGSIPASNVHVADRELSFTLVAAKRRIEYPTIK
jgi:hypothetical protein